MIWLNELTPPPFSIYARRRVVHEMLDLGGSMTCKIVNGAVRILPLALL
jgi:uncharacterized protein (UPF0261 family)